MSFQPTFPSDRYCPECAKSFSRPNDLRRHITQTFRHNNDARQRLYKKAFTKRSNISARLRAIGISTDPSTPSYDH